MTEYQAEDKEYCRAIIQKAQIDAIKMNDKDKIDLPGRRRIPIADWHTDIV